MTGSSIWKDATVLLTGGTGTFGQAFIRYLVQSEPVRSIRVFSRDELKQWEMGRRLHDDRMRYLLGDVRDRDRLERAFDGVDIVVHAAALKQVPAAEYNPFEAVKTNVLGAQNVIEAAIDRGISRVLALSTDKAANPVNLYGATKLCAEKLFIQGNAYSALHRTRFSAVRYGNVVASRGSVVPLFLEQRATGSLSVTDRRMTRFWITVGQAVALVKRAIESLHGGELFVPKLPSIRITDLAEAIAPGLPLREIGIRPGEKLHETLLTTEEAPRAFDGGSLFVVIPAYSPEVKDAWPSLVPLASDRAYTSDQNDQWLDTREIRGRLPGALAEAKAHELATVLAHEDSVVALE